MSARNSCVLYTSDGLGAKFQPGPGSNFSAKAGGTDSGRGRGFLIKICSPVRHDEVMKLFENLEKTVAGGRNFSN